MEHLEPLKKWLNELTGDAAAVTAFGETWKNIADRMESASDDLDRFVSADLGAMSGASITAYVAYANELAGQIRATPSWLPVTTSVPSGDQPTARTTSGCGRPVPARAVPWSGGRGAR